MTGHAMLVQPSGLHLTMACAASLLLQLMAEPVPPTEEELEGQAAHWHALQWGCGNRMEVGTLFKAVGKDWTVDTDMVAGAKLYAREAIFHNEARFETAVACHDVHPQCWGTPDYYRWMPEANMLKVVDYKYGHRYVDAFENWQLIAYAVGVIRQLNIPMTAMVKLVIVQPRCYFGNDGYGYEWTTTVTKLFEYIARVAIQVSVALAPGAQAHTGKHCLDCDARHLCTTLQQNGMHIAEYAGTGEAVNLSIAALGTEARIVQDAYDILKARLEGLKTQIEFHADKGIQVPYWTMAPGRALLKWNEGITVDDIRMLGLAAGVDTIHPPKPITATQAIDAGVAPEIVKEYATRGPTGKTLKPESNTLARKVFGAKTV